MQIQTYLMFDGRTEEAIDFYKKALGARVEMLMRFKDSPDGESCPGGVAVAGDKVMHAAFYVGDSMIMASDGMNTGKPNFQGFSLSLTAKDEADAERLFKVMGEGGQVQVPLGKTFFSPAFGMVADRFGVSWMVVVQPKA